MGSAIRYLRTVGITTSVGHRDNTRASVAKFEALILKLGSIDGLSSSSVSSGKITLMNKDNINR